MVDVTPKKIVLTGGPCSGKTTAQPYLYEKLNDAGVSTIFVPEVATMLINSGLYPWDFKSRDSVRRFQNLVLKTQVTLESIAHEAMSIKGGAKQVIIGDRGKMDNKAYMPEDEFRELLKKNGYDEVEARDASYDAVFHLVTAAIGAEKYYNLDNPARKETPEQAKILDGKTQEAWIGHPHLRVIDNSTDFAEKLKRLLNGVRKVLGIPVAIETERKFLLPHKFSLKDIPVPFRVIDIEQFYVRDKGGKEVRVRKRSQGGCGATFYKTIKLDTGSALSRIEIEEQISELEYYQSLTNQNPNFDPIRKQRVCFIYESQYFELDMFLFPDRCKGLTLLEIELTEENDMVHVPAWLGEFVEVTHDSLYKNFSLARRW